MIETLLSCGASARMMRLYSGMYLSVSGLASAMPWSISGTKFLGSLTNFFTTGPPLVVVGHGLGWSFQGDAGRFAHCSASASNMTATATAPASRVPMLRSPV